MTRPKRPPTTKLRAVSATERAPAKRAAARKPKTVTQAAAKGTPRELLVAMQARVASAVENPNTPARDLASLTKRLMEITREIEAIDARAEQEATEAGEATPDDRWEAV